jgi:2-methylcitrate dehydratase PrpD
VTTTPEVATGSPLARELGSRLHVIVAGDLPPNAIASAKLRLLHALRVSIASRHSPAVEVAHAAFMPATDGCLVLGRPGLLPGPDAAFVNGIAGHSSLQEDAGPGGLRDGSHPGTYVVPAALAAAEMSGESGRSLLLGLTAGYEAVGLIGEVAPPEIVKRRFRPVGVMGPIGAAAAAVGVWHGDAHAVEAAVAIGANMSAGFTQGILEGTMEPYIHAGAAARNGLLAARLALAGATTAAEAFEGPYGFFTTFGGTDGGELVEGTELAVTRVGTKRFAACLQNQETVALIVDTAPRHLDPAAVRRLVVRRPAMGTNGLNSPGVSGAPPFPNMLTAQMSARFTAAAALLGRPVDDPAFFARSFADPDVEAVARRTELEPTDGGVSVVVELDDGSRLVLDADMSDVLQVETRHVRDRFREHAGRYLGETRAADALALVDELEDVADIGELTALLHPEP